VCGRKFCTGCGRWRLLVDFQPLRTRGGVRSRCAACHRSEARAAHARRTAEQRRLRREYDRIWHDAKRRRDGVPVRICRRRSAVDKREGVYLPVAPLLSELKTWDGSYAELANLAGVPERAIYRFRYGESRRVQIDVADKLAIAMGTTSSLMWANEW
jgi:hypothetical protein